MGIHSFLKRTSRVFTPLELRLLGSIRESRMLIPGDRVGVAVSGGADSLALLRLLERLRAELGIRLLVLHFDHCLRGADSATDAEFVSRVAQESGLEFVLGREDVAAQAHEEGWNVEDAARRLRYSFFSRVVREGRATRVAVAHTADDQAETILARLIRGTGLTGLAAIYPVVGPVVRPLLRFRRQELRDYLESREEVWREDATNVDVRRLRARIRHELLPILERDFSPEIVRHLGEVARFAREEESFWEALAEDRFAKLASRIGQAWGIRVEHLLVPLELKSASAGATSQLPLRPLTERLIRRMYEAARGSRRELQASHVEQVIHLAASGSSGHRVELPHGIVVERSFDDLVFMGPGHACCGKTGIETESAPRAYQYLVNLPDRGAASVAVPELGTCFRLKVVDWPVRESETKSDGAALDAHLLRTPLILRNWRPGDAYRPRGHRRVRKLKRMFLSGRVPRRQRDSWPVLESGGQVVWARGIPPADEVCAGVTTRRGVLIEEAGI